MKAKVEKLVREPCEIEITGATLLTVDEAEQLLTEKDRARGSWWWLRSPGHLWNNAANVLQNGHIYKYGLYILLDSGGVRPALKIENLECSNLEIGDKFCFGNEYFKVISANLALCNSIVGYTRFDEKSNDYAHSEIKAYVDHWFDKMMNRGADA